MNASAWLVGLSVLAIGGLAAAGRAPATGPLRVHPKNPRYFTDGSGRAIYLTGSHTWANLVDMGPSDPPPKYDFDACLDWMVKLDHNFIRLWTWELTTWDTRANGRWGKPKPHFVSPQPWLRTGPGKALDGKPKFDLSKFDPDYFKRLRTRVETAGKRGVYVSIMLFEGWGLQFSPGAWKAHPLNRANNVQGTRASTATRTATARASRSTSWATRPSPPSRRHMSARPSTPSTASTTSSTRSPTRTTRRPPPGSTT